MIRKVLWYMYAIVISHYSTSQVSTLIRLPKCMLGMTVTQILLNWESQLLRQILWNHWYNLWSTTTTMTLTVSWLEGRTSGFCIKYVLILMICSLNHKMWAAMSSSSPALQLLLMLSRPIPMKPVLLQSLKHSVTSVLLWQAQSLCPTRLVLLCSVKYIMGWFVPSLYC